MLHFFFLFNLIRFPGFLFFLHTSVCVIDSDEVRPFYKSIQNLWCAVRDSLLDRRFCYSVFASN